MSNVCEHCGGEVGVAFTILADNPAIAYCKNNKCDFYEENVESIPPEYFNKLTTPKSIRRTV